MKVLIFVYLMFSVLIVLFGIFVVYICYGMVELSMILSVLLLNVIFGFVLLWIVCYVYNWVVLCFGGIEIVLFDLLEEV